MVGRTVSTIVVVLPLFSVPRLQSKRPFVC